MPEDINSQEVQQTAEYEALEIAVPRGNCNDRKVSSVLSGPSSNLITNSC